MTCTVTPEDYARTLRQLMPPGPATQFDGAEQIEKLLLALADTYNAVHERSCDLLQEVVPKTTREMLPDWERVAGLPDECAGAQDTFEARRAAVVNRIGQVGGQSPDFYIALAASYGFEIEITEYNPMTAGMQCGQPLNNNDDGESPYGWQFVWTVKATTSTVFALKAGLGRAGEPLRSWGNTVLECVMNKWKPAHTMIIFDYGDLEYV